MPSSHEVEPYSDVFESRRHIPPGNETPKSYDRRGARGILRQLALWTGIRHLRESWDWAHTPRLTLPTVAELSKSLAALDQVSSKRVEPDDAESPIFLLATGWRTGSTLLQRIIVTDPKLLLWGEPFGEMAMFSTLVEVLSRLSTFPNLSQLWAGEDLTSSAETSALMAQSWIATLYPTGMDLRIALRAFLSRWLGRPATERGFSRWGFKEVRLGATEALLLRWLYPNAKFVILSRHPFNCYRSLADSGWHHVYHRRPDIRVDSAAGFARHWNRLALSWSELPAGFPSVHIRYEDLVQGKVDFRELESWLGIKVNEETALSVVVGQTSIRQTLSWFERFVITSEATPGMRALGYSK
jgi:hypothetical protein